MRARGITYSTGFVRNGTNSRGRFDLDVVERELKTIRDDLHCNAVRVVGGDPARLEQAAAFAADLGLEVWFSPYPLELATGEVLALLTDCAERAERIRRRGAEVVFVAGAELSLMNPGFLPGDTQEERLDVLLNQRARLPQLVGDISLRINEFLGKAVPDVRARFGGKVTYASVPLERVDWSQFDIVSVDLYRSAEVAGTFAEGVRSLVAQGKPAAITEFGMTAYRGASDRGARCMEIVQYDPMRLDGAYERDEPGQAAYLTELLDIFDREGVDSTFVFLFALYDFPHRPGGDPRDDLDLASPGIVKVYEDGSWEPKAAFGALADAYRTDQYSAK
jgi:hypothetical protein